jgi:hypothetical protein
MFSGCGNGNDGPNPPVVGQTSCFTVTVRVVNQAAQAITFSASNLVTANVPGGGAVYAGIAGVSQGSITAQPAMGGTGNVTWNPGTLAAGATALLDYKVKVTPTSAGQRIPLTATPASGNGTRAQYVDTTGNTTQTRATFLFGPLCELAVTQGLLTPALVSDVRATATVRGTVVAWSTSSEIGAVAFDVLRFDPAARRFVKVNETPLPARIADPQGARYEFLDTSAPPAESLRYAIVDRDAAGATKRHGPFVLQVGRSHGASAVAEPQDFASRAKGLHPAARVEGSGGASTAPDSASPAGNAVLAAHVATTGVYRISAQAIARALGVPTGPVRKDLAKHDFRLSLLGDEVGWLGESGGDALLFYGQASASPFSADNVYLLERRGGSRQPPMVDRGAGAVAAATFRSDHHEEQ